MCASISFSLSFQHIFVFVFVFAEPNVGVRKSGKVMTLPALTVPTALHSYTLPLRRECPDLVSIYT